MIIMFKEVNSVLSLSWSVFSDSGWRNVVLLLLLGCEYLSVLGDR